MIPPEKREEWIIRQARERLGAERSGFLDGACAGDLALRERLERLLAVPDHPKEESAVAVDTATVKATSKLDFADEPRGETIDSTIGHYKVLQSIGEGGCGAVYMAEQTEPVRRRVALKVIKLGMDTKAVIARFEAERQALALMDHPNIAKVLDAGSTDSGRPYFVMELVRGIKITEYCDQNRLDTQQRLDLFIQICQAIQHAHQKGIIHRDIKPSNILVTLHDGIPVPKVIDFGIAKATTDQRLTDKTLFTAYEQFIGTPAYMSPEQAEMSGLDIDTRSDIYSLGVLLYELLTGRTPFDARELMSLGIDAMRKTIREKEPVRPSTKLHTLQGEDITTTALSHGADLPKLVHLLRGDLDWIVMKCLEKDRTRRYDTANGLAMDIKRHLNYEPVVARPPSKLYEFQKTVRRHKVGFAATGAVIVTLAIGVVASTWQSVQATRAKRAAVAAQASESVQRQKAEANEQKAQAAAKLATQESANTLSFARRLRVETYAADMRAADAAMNQDNRGSALGLLKRYFPTPGEEDLRGIEWRYLWQECQSDQLKTFVHDGIVNAVVFSPDGRFVLSSSFDGRTRVWDVTTGEVVRQFEGTSLQRPCQPLAFSPDGQLLACCCPDGVVLRRTLDWEIDRQLPGVWWSVAFSPDGKLLAATSKEGVQLWDTTAWQHMLFKDRFDSFFSRLAFSPDSRLLAASTSAATRIWNISSRSPIATLPVGAVALAFAPGNRWLAAGYANGLLEIWDMETQQIAVSNKVHASYLHGLAFSPEGGTLATGGSDQLIRLWRWQTAPSGPPTLEEPRTLQGHQNEVWSLGFSRDGAFLVSSGKDGTAILWSTAPKQPRTLTWNLQPNQMFLGFSSNGQLLYSVDGQAKVCSWNLANLNQVDSFALPPDAAASRPPLVQDGMLWLGTTNGNIAVYDLGTGQAGKTIQVGTGSVIPTAVSRDKHRVAVWSDGDKPARLRNLETGMLEAAFPDAQQQWPEFPAAFSPDGRYLAYADGNFQVKVWNIPERRNQLTIHAHRWFIQDVVYSPDGKLLATASHDGTAKLWDVATGKQAAPTLNGHLAGVWLARFSPDGKTLVTSDLATSICFWHVVTGKEMITRQFGGWFHLSSDGNAIIMSPRQGQMPWLSGSQVIHLPSLAEIDAKEKTEQSSGTSFAAVQRSPSARVEPETQQP